MSTKPLYRTKQREAAETFFKSHPDDQFSIDDIAANLSVKGVSKSSVYRIISLFVNQGFIKKYPKENGVPAMYQYMGGSSSCESHFHLKCTKCGRIVHLANGLSDTVQNLMRENNFEINEQLTVFVGKCNNCGKTEKFED